MAATRAAVEKSIQDVFLDPEFAAVVGPTGTLLLMMSRLTDQAMAWESVGRKGAYVAILALITEMQEARRTAIDGQSQVNQAVRHQLELLRRDVETLANR